MEPVAAAARAKEVLEGAQDVGFDDVRTAVKELLPLLLDVRLGLDDAAREEFVRETAPLIPAVAFAIDWSQRDVRKLVASSAQNNRWDRVAWARSELQAVPDLYAGSVPDDDLPDLDELDELLREEAPEQNGLTADDVPDGMPRSHWWWWAPDDPPTDEPRADG